MHNNCLTFPIKIKYYSLPLHSIPCELVRMTFLATRELGEGLLNARRWKLTVSSHTAAGKPTLHSALWEQ